MTDEEFEDEEFEKDEYANRHTSKVDAQEERGADFVFDEEPITC